MHGSKLADFQTSDILLAFRWKSGRTVASIVVPRTTIFDRKSVREISFASLTRKVCDTLLQTDSATIPGSSPSSIRLNVTRSSKATSKC